MLTRLWLAGVTLALLQAGPTPELIWGDAGTTLLGMPSRDGRLLSCVDLGTGDLAVRNLQTGTMKRLTNKGAAASKEFAYFSTISPDSARVAFAWFNDAGFYDLRVVKIDGSELRVLYRNEEAGFVQPAAWSPDGKSILTLFFRKDNTSQIALVDASTGKVQVLRSLEWVYPKKMDFSPDGRYIVYDTIAKTGATERDLYVLAVDGSAHHLLAGGPSDDGLAVWSPTSPEVLFASDRSGTLDLWSMPVKDGKPAGEPVLLKRDLGRFLPLGIVNGRSLLYGVRVGGSEIVVTPASRIPNASAPAWSPDGKRLAHLTRAGAENFGQQAKAIVVRTLETGESKVLNVKLAHIESIAWSTDSRSLLVSGSDGKGRAGLFRVDAASGATSLLIWKEDAPFRGIKGVEVSGVVYYIHEGLRRTGPDALLYQPKQPISHLAVSADGNRIAVAQDDKIVILDAKGAELAQVPAKNVPTLQWIGETLYAGVDRYKSTGEPAGALELPGYKTGAVALHPNGRTAAFVRESQQQQIWRIDLPERE